MSCGCGRQRIVERNSSGSTARWRQVRITDIRMLWALAPGQVRLPPQTCNRVTTGGAHADMHVELSIDHRARDLGLVLRGDVRFADLRTRPVRARRGRRKPPPYTPGNTLASTTKSSAPFAAPSTYTAHSILRMRIRALVISRRRAGSRRSCRLSRSAAYRLAL
jgi:hypothetical protein